MLKYEKIVNKRKELFAFEVLIQDAFRLQWDSININLLNNLTLVQIDAVLNLSKLKNDIVFCKKYFINMERKQLLDEEFIKIVSEKCKYAYERGFKIYFELTERDSSIISLEQMEYIKERYKLKFVADDVELNDVRWSEISHGLYDFIKMEKIPSTTSERNILSTRHTRGELIIERIEKKSEFNKAINSDFYSYFQGYLFK
ncbi:hypothetical protein [Vibrio owensii]|uniref:hypothetical protein n=1 Tax=Vibrio owensii TaxID=696485 RepID=UPI004068C030